MAAIRSYTDIEQSRKLAEILPLESADMVLWGKDFKSVYADIHAQEFMKGLECRKMNYVPCWSLVALLSVLPEELEDNHFLTLQKEKNEYCCCYKDINGNSFRHTFASNPVDACVTMIEKLHELKKL